MDWRWHIRNASPSLNLPSEDSELTYKNGMRPVHPGGILGEKLRELEMSATGLATALGVPANRITAILNGQRSVTADTALRLARYFGMPAQFWMNRQQAFELRAAEIKSGKAIERSVQPRMLGAKAGGCDRPVASSIADGRQPAKGSVSSVTSNVSIAKEELASVCKAHGIRRLAIFGSALRDDFHSESDIDVLAEFQPRRVPGLLGIAGIEIELSKLFGGRRVDLRTPEDLSPYFRQQVLDDAEVQYAQA